MIFTCINASSENLVVDQSNSSYLELSEVVTFLLGNGVILNGKLIVINKTDWKKVEKVIII